MSADDTPPLESTDAQCTPAHEPNPMLKPAPRRLARERRHLYAVARAGALAERHVKPVYDLAKLAHDAEEQTEKHDEVAVLLEEANRVGGGI